MSWIKEISSEEATGKLKELFESIGGRTSGNIANILKVHSLNSEALEAHLNLYKTIMFGESNITRTQREMIATVVSNTNACEYWTVHHGEALRHESSDNQIMKDIVDDFTKANITKKEKLMLCYAKKLTENTSSIKERDIIALHKAGFSDRDIFDINQVVAYFNYVNRIADGLGVKLEM